MQTHHTKVCITKSQVPLEMQVLRDEHKRAAYDAQRRGGLGAGGGFGMGSPAAAASGAWRPGTSGFDEAFASWFERQGCAPCSTAVVGWVTLVCASL